MMSPVQHVYLIYCHAILPSCEKVLRLCLYYVVTSHIFVVVSTVFVHVCCENLHNSHVHLDHDLDIMIFSMYVQIPLKRDIPGLLCLPAVTLAQSSHLNMQY